MLTIRADQIRALESSTSDHFARRVAASGRQRLPGCCSTFSESEIWLLCEAGIAAAARYGIREQDDLVLFLDVVLAHGAEFGDLDAFGWAVPLLEDDSLSGSVKVAMLFDRMPERLWPETVSRAGLVE